MSFVKLVTPLNSSWGTAALSFNQVEIDFPFYIPTGEVFNHDPARLIRLKHLALTVLTPLMTVIRSVYWLALSIFSTFAAAYHYLDDDNVSSESLLKIKETAYDAVRAWKYGILMTGCALAGIAAPFWGRLHYGYFERTLNRHPDGPRRDKFYTALCFQRLSILSKENPLHDEKAAQKIEKYLNRVDEISEQFWSFSWLKLANGHR